MTTPETQTENTTLIGFGEANDIGRKPELSYVDVKQIKVDHKYQRDELSIHVKSILNNFNWKYFQPVTLARRPDNSYNVVDGQHRVAAAKLHPNVFEIPALIINSNGTGKDEAVAFVKINGNRRNITPIDKYHAALMADDKEALILKHCLDDIGCKIAEHKSQKAPNVTNAIAACIRIIKKFGVHPLQRAIMTLRKTWPNQKDALRADLMEVLAELYYSNKNIQIDHLVNELRALGMMELFNLTRSLVRLGGGSKSSMRRVIVQIYNKPLEKFKHINAA